MFKHILLPLDGSTLSEKALAITTSLARATGAKVTLLQSVVTTTYAYVAAPLGGAAYQQGLEGEVIHATNYLKKVEQRLHECGVTNVETKVMTTTPTVAIRETLGYGGDLIVMSTHGRTGVARTLWGSVADEVVRAVNVPVLLVSTRQQLPETNGCAPNFRRILVPLDGSALAEQALPIAGALAQVEEAEVVLLNVEPQPVAVGAITDNRDAKADRYLNQAALCVLPSDVAYETIETGGEAGAAIIRAAHERDCDLIVMSTHGRSGFTRLRLGSVADEVIAHTPVPLLLLHGQNTSENN